MVDTLHPGRIRALSRGEWASIYSSTQGAKYGALFMTFHVDGNPRKATAYFKNVSGQVIDEFTVMRD